MATEGTGRLAAKVIIVTGAASGIGRTIAHLCAREGATVEATDVDAAGLEETALGAKLGSVGCDLTRPDEVTGFVGEIMGANGRIDALIHCAGVTLTGDRDIPGLDFETWERTLAINLTGTFLICKAVIPYMVTGGGGSIVNISAASALRGTGGAAYSTSKGGVNTLTKVIATQHAKDNIRANAICPGPIDSPMLAASLKKLGLSEYPFRPGTLGRLGTTEEVAWLAVYLASDEAAFTTGAIYTIDGGQSQY